VLGLLATQTISCSDNVTGHLTIVDGWFVARGPPLQGWSFPSSSRPRRRYGRERSNGRSAEITSVLTTHDRRERAVFFPLPGGVYEVWVGGTGRAVMSQQVIVRHRGSSRASLIFTMRDIVYTGAPSLGTGLASGSVFVGGSTNTHAPSSAGTHASTPCPPCGTSILANRTKGSWGVPRVKFTDHGGRDTTIDFACDGTCPGVVRTYGSVQYGAIVSATAPAPPPELHGFEWLYASSSTACTSSRDPPPGADTLGTLDTLGVNVTAHVLWISASTDRYASAPGE